MNKHTMRPATIQKYKAIQARYKELFEVQRLRLDDVMKTLSQEFFLCEARIVIILKINFDDEHQPSAN